jgi:RNA polymerase sigma factor (sigma-70 family)
VVPAPASPRWRRVRDTALVEACLDGDEDAWSELVFRYSRLVYSIPRRYGLDVDASQDVFQEVFAILVRQLPRIRRQAGLPKWLMTTTHRVCRQWFNRAARTPEAHLQPLDDDEPPPTQMLKWERQHLVHQALRELGGRCEELLTALFTHQGPTNYQDVARALGIAVGSIGPSRARCFAKLLEIYQRLERGDPGESNPNVSIPASRSPK